MLTIGQDIISGNMGYIGTEPGRLYRMGPQSKVAEVSGEPPVVLTDCKKKPLKGLKIYGKSVQKTTTGAQLLDFDSLLQDKGYNNNGELQDNKGYVSTQLISVTGNGNYTISGLKNITVIILQYSSDKTLLSRKASNSNGTYAMLEDTCYIGLTFYSNTTVDMLTNVMLNAGSTPLPWEPYTGGKPSPSPDYPQEIVSVGTRWSTGTNLLDPSKFQAVHQTYGLDIDFDENGNADIHGTFSFDENIGESHVASFRFIIAREKVSFSDNTKYAINVIESVGATNVRSGSYSSLKEDYPSLVIIAEITNGEEVYIKLRPIIYIGDTVPEYEPYTGGVPKPYGDKIGVEVRGKNLLRIDDTLERYESDGYEATTNRIITSGMLAIGLDDVNRFLPVYVSDCLIDNGVISYHTNSAGFAVGIGTQLAVGKTYLCSFESTNNGRLCLLYYDNKGVFLRKQDFVKSKFTVPENVAYTVLLFRDADKAGDYKFWNIQLEINDTPTAYEPYREPQSISISTSNGLPGIPVSSGGNYTDADGQQWVCDEIDFGRGVYVQRIGIVDLSTIPWRKDENYISSKTVLQNFIAETNRSILPFSRCEYNYGGDCFFIDKNGTIYFGAKFSKKFETLEAFTAYIQEHDSLMYCQLRTPIETPLTADQLAAYKALRTYKGTTIIDNDAGAYMSVKYNT